MAVRDSRPRFIFDSMTAMFVGLFVAVQLVAVWFAVEMTGTVTPSVPEQSGDAGVGAQLVGVIVLETIVLVLAWRYASLLPQWVRKGVKLTVIALGGIYLVWTAALLFGEILGAALIALYAGVYLLSTHYNVYWLLHNIAAGAVAILAASGLGSLLGPRSVLVFLALLTVWDMVAVWKSGWMDGLIAAFGKHRIPAFFVFPAAAQIDMERLSDWLGQRDGPKPDDVAGLLGVGDIAVPAGLVVSTILAFPAAVYEPVVAATIIGGAIAIASLRTTLDSGTTVPALPWISTGCVAGFAAGVLVSSMSVVTFLGGVGA